MTFMTSGRAALCACALALPLVACGDDNATSGMSAPTDSESTMDSATPDPEITPDVGNETDVLGNELNPDDPIETDEETDNTMPPANMPEDGPQ